MSPQVLNKRLKHSIEKYKELQVDYDELKMFSEKVKIAYDKINRIFIYTIYSNYALDENRLR